MVSSGKSGSFFLRTTDGRYLLKTLSSEEFSFFQSFLPAYESYVLANPNTILSRATGLYLLAGGASPFSHCPILLQVTSAN